MSTSVPGIAIPRGVNLRPFLKPGNVLPATVWAFLVYNQILASSFPPPLPNLLVVLIHSAAIVLFIIRRDPSRVGNKMDGLLAVSGTFFVAFLGSPHAPGTNWPATTIQVVGLLGWCWAFLCLGRSFGLVAADRGLKRHGSYRFLRHPMYAAELVFFLGFLMAVPTLSSALIIAVWWGLQVARILREEAIFQDYDDYRAQVRWRVIPGLW